MAGTDTTLTVLKGAGGLDTRELKREMLDYLREVVASKPEGRQLGSGVAAASRVLAHCEWYEERAEEPRKVMLRLLNGDKQRLRVWLEAELATITMEQMQTA